MTKLLLDKIKSSLGAIFVALFVFISNQAKAYTEPSRSFSIYVAPNNSSSTNNVALIVTAINDNTSFTISDDGADGDTDDTKSGVLMSGQSYILYIKDNAINDDFSGAGVGTLKADGDFFKITASDNVIAYQATDGDNSHDWLSAISSKGVSKKFLFYNNKSGASKHDINVMAYSDSTYVILKKISSSSTFNGTTNVNSSAASVVFAKWLNVGQDLIYSSNLGIDVLEDGTTYIIESNKNIGVQYGALSGAVSDGGNYVLSAKGNLTSNQIIFSVPFTNAGEQEIRITSYSSSNTVKLYQYASGAWVQLKSWTLGQYAVQDWVGKLNSNQAYSTLFKVECSTSTKSISVFEGNAIESVTSTTNDIVANVPDVNGNGLGKQFVAYLLPPLEESNSKNNVTGVLFSGKVTHLYVTAKSQAIVTIKDTYTSGKKYNKSFTVQAGKFLDIVISEAEWKKIYNGSGTPSGSARAYVTITSTSDINVQTSNFENDFCSGYSSDIQNAINQNLVVSYTGAAIAPNQSVILNSSIGFNETNPLTNVKAKIFIPASVDLINCSLLNVTTNTTIASTQNGNWYEFNIGNTVAASNQFLVAVQFKNDFYNPDGSISMNLDLFGFIFRVEAEQSTQSFVNEIRENVLFNPSDTKFFTFKQNSSLDSFVSDSWSVALVDFDKDGDDDVFFTNQDGANSNKMFVNNGSGVFNQLVGSAFDGEVSKSMTSTWGDFDNDGDLDVVIANNTQSPCSFFVNNGNGTFTKNTIAAFTKNKGYYHHASWVDVNNDGKLELFLANYLPTRFNELWKQDQSGNWVLWSDNLLSQIDGSSIGSSWADYDNDGFQDLILMNNSGGKNRMYHNLGNGEFEVVSNIITSNGGHSVSSVWGDIDNDGDLDLFISNSGNVNNELYINNKGTFNQVKTGSIVNDGGHSHGASFGDIDKDGDLDLFVANDQGKKFLYLNNGDGTFVPKTNEWINADFGYTFSTAFGDLDKDGDLDLVEATHSNQKNLYFTNNGNTNKWIAVKLVGSVSNKAGIGAKVKVKVNGTWQTREVNSQSGFGSTNSFTQFFGINSTTINKVDSILVIWPSGFTQVLTDVYTNKVNTITETIGNKVTGILYFDANNNCKKDANEKLMTNVKVTFDGGKFKTYTNSAGVFTLYMVKGAHTLALDNSKYLSCSFTPTFTFSSTSGGSKNFGNIGIKPKCSGSDLAISAYTVAIRRGFENTYTIQIENNGLSDASNLTVSASIPSELLVLSADVNWLTNEQSGNTNIITWNLSSLLSGELKNINLKFKGDLSLVTNTQFVSSFTVTSSGIDCYSFDNNYTDYQLVVGSMDPNDLLVYPFGDDKDHAISEDQAVTYRIRFQNVGNYKADFVNVTDELPTTLDVSSITNTHSSHRFELSVLDNTLHFYFPNIDLPDSTTNEEASNGFVEFTILPVKGLDNGTIITNSAAIQFDYNDVIKTNDVSLKVISNSNKNGQVITYPNPAVDSFHTKVEIDNEFNPELSEIWIQEMEGSVVMNQTDLLTTTYKVDAQDLKSGTYFITVKDIYGRIFKGKVIIVK